MNEYLHKSRAPSRIHKASYGTEHGTSSFAHNSTLRHRIVQTMNFNLLQTIGGSLTKHQKLLAGIVYEIFNYGGGKKSRPNASLPCP